MSVARGFRTRPVGIRDSWNLFHLADKSSQGEPSKRAGVEKARANIRASARNSLKPGAPVALNGPRDIRDCIELTGARLSVDISITSTAMIDRARESLSGIRSRIKGTAAACARIAARKVAD